MAKLLYGIGTAKTSFALELIYPDTCNVVCLDTHILQLYGYRGSATPSNKGYVEMESHWLSLCKKASVPSPIARHIYWDDLQQKPDCRYWSHVFERRR